METPQDQIICRCSRKLQQTVASIGPFEQIELHIENSYSRWYNQLFWGTSLVFHRLSFILVVRRISEPSTVGTWRNYLFHPLPSNIASMPRLALRYPKYWFFNGFQWLFTSPFPCLFPIKVVRKFLRQSKIARKFAHKPWPLNQHGDFFLKAYSYFLLSVTVFESVEGRIQGMIHTMRFWCQLFGTERTTFFWNKHWFSTNVLGKAFAPFQTTCHCAALFFHADDSQSQAPQVSFMPPANHAVGW